MSGKNVCVLRYKGKNHYEPTQSSRRAHRVASLWRYRTTHSRLYLHHHLDSRLIHFSIYDISQSRHTPAIPCDNLHPCVLYCLQILFPIVCPGIRWQRRSNQRPRRRRLRHHATSHVFRRHPYLRRLFPPHTFPDCTGYRNYRLTILQLSSPTRRRPFM